MITGTSILVDKTIAPLISTNDILLEGRAQFITLQFLDNGSLIVINIYTAISSIKRAPMWKRLSENNFLADHVILGKDFNHFEETNRRETVGECQMHRREVATWHHMTLQYGLSDA
jgi:hypothetical protein